MDNHPFWIGKPSTKGQFSIAIAMLDYQRVHFQGATFETPPPDSHPHHPGIPNVAAAHAIPGGFPVCVG